MDAVVTWFKNIENNHISLFIKFDIVDFYPSGSKDLLMNAINFTKSIAPIHHKIIKTILHAVKLLLFNEKEVWFKKDNPHFVVLMGISDSAEVCKLVGLYLRQESGDNKIGLHRDDELSFFRNLSAPESEIIKKKLCKIFKQHEFNITLECNFDLQTRKSYPYRKVNNECIIYIFISHKIFYHLSPNKFLSWSIKEYLIFHLIKSALIKLSLTTITYLKTAFSTKISNSHHKLLKK